MKLLNLLIEERVKPSLSDFWDMVEIRLKMLQCKNKGDDAASNLPEWTKLIRIENIFRQCDKTCVYIMTTKEFRKDPVKVALFTLVNSPNSWEQYIESNAPSLKDHIKNMSRLGQTAFHGAYMVNAPRHVIMKSEAKFIEVVTQGIKDKLEPVEFHKLLLTIPGIADFMAHQVIINLQLCGHLNYDKSYVKLGPGSSKGLELLKMPVKEESLSEILKQIPDRIKKMTPKLTKEGSSMKAKPCDWNEETIENCLCIYQKMLKFRQTGKTKRVYTTKNTATSNYEAPGLYK
jgi:hypothetical protein